MGSRTINLALAAALVMCLSLSVPAHASAAAGVMGGGVKTFAPKKRAGVSVTFRVPGMAPWKVRRGYVRAGRYTRSVRTARLRRAAARPRAAKRRIAVRLPARPVRRRGKVRLVVVIAKTRRSKPRSADEVREVGAIEQPAADVEPVASPPATDSPDAGTSAPGETEQVADPAAAPSEPVAEAAPEPAPTPEPAGEKSLTRPVGSPILSDAEAAARVRRSSWEPRPDNAEENQRVPQAGELDLFLENNISVFADHKALVTGNFTGTTDEIIQWAAWKWGLDEDVLRAVVVKESWWRMSAVGDAGLSFGLTQIKTTFHAGTYPLSNSSTAFNLDYYGALFRYYYEGHASWLNDMDKGQDYAAGDLWGAVGAHFAGRWYTEGAESYIADVKRHLEQRTWESADF